MQNMSSICFISKYVYHMQRDRHTNTSCIPFLWRTNVANINFVALLYNLVPKLLPKNLCRKDWACNTFESIWLTTYKAEDFQVTGHCSLAQSLLFENEPGYYPMFVHSPSHPAPLQHIYPCFYPKFTCQPLPLQSNRFEFNM